MSDENIAILSAEAERNDELVGSLLEIWEGAVRATHFFLTEKDIEALRPVVRDGLRQVSTLVVANGEAGEPAAFMGIDGDKIEALYVAPEARGKGVGRQLVRLALNKFKADKLDVNEDNPQGLGFYMHLGFAIVGRSPVDGQGNPFPLLHMKFSGAPAEEKP